VKQPLPVSKLRRLYRLQQVDSELLQTEERLKTLDPGAALSARAEEAEAALAAARGELASRQSRLRDLELELQSTVARRKHMEAEMYSGRVRNPKELAAMQEDVAMLDRHAHHLEDVILTLMEEVETLQARVRALDEAAGRARAELVRHLEARQRQQETLQAALQTLRREREQVIGQIDEELLRRYDRIRERLGPLAVVAVRRGVCEGCHVAIPEGRMRRLQEEEDLLLTCEGCGRILVLPE